jgi:seryl-tRNA synthetase
MLDPKIIRQNPEAVGAQLARRGYFFDINLFSQLESQRRKFQLRTQELQSERNHLSKEVGMAKAKHEDAREMIEKLSEIGDQLDEAEHQLNEVQQGLQDLFLGLPNLLHDSVPEGKDAEHNVEVRRWGKLPSFNFVARDHISLGEKGGGLDFETAASLSGSRFCVLQGKLARLHRALGQFMLDMHVKKHGYQEVYVPFLVHSHCLVGTGQLPKFKEDFFYVSDKDLCLIPTGEVPLTNMARDKIFNVDQLPIKLVTQTPCFRSEAGSYGKDTRGMIRQHQFEKVELVQLVKAEQSNNALEELTRHAEAILEALELPYRVMLLCAGDTGFGSAKTYDLEVWLPGQNAYREISSCSNCTDFQARRIQARCRETQGGKPELLHTLNGSGLAIGRTLVAIMENYQTETGTIHVPKVLQNYMGCEEI